MAELVTGFDIGGAHLKAAQVTVAGRVVAALQVPCALWQGLDRLETALAEALTRLEPVTRTAVTMTGELADLFPDRAAGVRRLIETVTVALPEVRHAVWAGRLHFLPPAEAAAHPGEVASANWLATATLAARRVDQGLFIDLGSTTTDLLLFKSGEVAAQGLTDRDRLVSGELVYTGLTRSFVMAVAREAPFAGRRVGLMNEYFASMADVYRVLGVLPEEADQHPAADNGPKTPKASARRLARMIGADLADGDMADWRRLAAWLAMCQMRTIEDAAHLQLSRGLIDEAAPVIGAGCGRFLLTALAQRLGRPYRDFSDLVESADEAGLWIATCAAAVAVAMLAADTRAING